MIFLEPEDLIEMLKPVSPDEFINHMIEVGELDERTGNYGEDVYSLCNNGVAYILKMLSETWYVSELTIVEGNFNGSDHTWIQVGDYNIDLTLAQFIHAPKIAITNKDAQGYNPQIVYNHLDWIKKLADEEGLI